MLRIGTCVDWLELKGEDNRLYGKTELSAFKAVALFFYPKDFTSICTAQVCSFRDRYEEIRRLGGVAFGISQDSKKKHGEFKRAHRLPYDLISDPNGNLGKRFGIARFGGWLWHKRVTFILDPSLCIAGIIHNERNAEIHADEFIRHLKTVA